MRARRQGISFPLLDLTYDEPHMSKNNGAASLYHPPWTPLLQHSDLPDEAPQLTDRWWTTVTLGTAAGGLSLMGSVRPVTCNQHFILSIATVRGCCPPICKGRNQVLERLGNQPKVMETGLESRPNWFQSQCYTRPGGSRHWTFASVPKTGPSNRARLLICLPPHQAWLHPSQEPSRGQALE